MYRKVICYIDSLQMGGAERVMANLCNSFVKNGKDVILVNDFFPEKEKKEYYIHPQIKRVFLERKKGFRLFSSIYRIWSLRKIFRVEKPDIIISFLGPCNIRAVVANIGLNTHILVSVRNDPFKEYGSGIRKILANMLFRLADGYVFQTQDAASYFSESIQRKSRILFNPVHSKFYKKEWNGKNKEISVVGRLQQQKNPILAVDSFKKVSDEFYEYKLVFYGDDELKREIITKSVEYGLSDRIIVYGKCDNIEDKLADTALFLLTSDYEGMPNSLLEAMAVGVPVVSTDCPCGGPKFATMNGTAGVLVKCGDSQEIANAIRKILSNSDLQKSLSVTEKKRAADFKEDVVFQEWDKYIIDLLAHSRVSEV